MNRVGIFVFKDAFKAQGYSGFCLTDDEFPIIYVNNSTHENRQMFTLFHELAHLLFDTSGIDTAKDEFIGQLTGRGKRIETACNSFAGSFLLPEDAFDAAMEGQAADEYTASEIADTFKVSRAVVFHRFHERALISDDAYGAAMAAFNKPRGGSGKGGGNYYATQISYLGRPYIRTALARYYQQRINREQLADYLNIKARYVDAFEAAFEKGGA
jgi:Zn-dependent peptidase ImmA (M78 family)